MPAVCPACRSTYKASGLANHLRQSRDPRCQAYQRDRLSVKPRDEHEPNTRLAGGEGDTVEESPMETDPDGDFFGNYADYDTDELGIVEDENEDDHEADEGGYESDEERDAEIFEATLEEEATGGLEPERTMNTSASDAVTEEEDVPRNPAARLRGGAVEALGREPFVVNYPSNSRAGMIYSVNNISENHNYTGIVGDSGNPFAPFASQLEWEIAKWAKLRGPSSTAFTELMSIDGVVERLGLTFKNANELNKVIDKSLPGRPRFERHEVMIGAEVFEVFFRDVIACIRALFGDPDFAPYLVFVPEKHYTNDEETSRVYHDMHTGRWWWTTQEALERDNPGATILPVIISTDKTQLTLFRNKSAYPIYLTIGNIPKEIRRKPSARAYVLLGYLPTTRLDHVSNLAARRRLIANLYHACMKKVLAPLEEAGLSGVMMTSGDGATRRNHPLLACVVNDYPEQVLTTGTFTGECPKCPTPRDELGEHDSTQPPGLRELEEVLKALDSFDTDPAGFLQACAKIGIKPIVDPFWKDLPYVHIYRSITPDILHQLYQGVVKHLIVWITEACGAAEIDARCRRMPPNHNIRVFMKGITTLSRVTGQEHDQMCRILMGLIIDLPLLDGLSGVRLIRAVRAILDFLYLAQYPVHTDETLQLLDDALTQFHDSKDIFVDLGIRQSFNIPKLHFMRHYSTCIKLFGTTDNYNTEYTERLHIDLAKDAYAATNHKDEFTQMTIWLERKEKILRHVQYVKWRLDGSPMPEPQEWLPPGLELDRSMHLAKHPNVRAVPIEVLEERYGAVFFRTALARFVALANQPDLTAAQLERSLWGVRIPFRKLPVWHRIKFLRTDPFNKKTSTADSIHVRPAKVDNRGRPVPGRFDTALVNDGTGGDTGTEGYQVGRVRVVFSLPEKANRIMFRTGVLVPQQLAYVEWYTAFSDEAEPNHLLHKISPLKDRDGGRICSVIPLANIRRSVHLFPKFGPVAPQEWTSSNVLDLCNTFFVNSFTDRHLYRII